MPQHRLVWRRFNPTPKVTCQAPLSPEVNIDSVVIIDRQEFVDLGGGRLQHL